MNGLQECKRRPQPTCYAEPCRSTLTERKRLFPAACREHVTPTIGKAGMKKVALDAYKRPLTDGFPL